MIKFKVSQSAVRRVKHPLPIPTICPHCGNEVIRAHNKTLYGKEYGLWPFVYICVGIQCHAYVGIHPNTDIPLGTLADEKTRKARSAAKAAFHPMWTKDGINKDAAYAWLAEKMGKPQGKMHVGWCNYEECMRVVEICNKHRQSK